MNAKRRNDPRQRLTLEEFPRLQPGLVLLGQAYQAAREAGTDVWEFSIDEATVRKAGLTDASLEWLVRRKYLQRRSDRASSARSRKANSRTTRFVATKVGATLARKLLVATELIAEMAGGELLPLMNSASGTLPHWDPVCRELHVGRTVVRQFRRSAPNQELILSAFQDRGWPQRIGDPLPPKEDIDPAARLHDTIKYLNRGLAPKLVCFTGDGTGTGIEWHRTNSTGRSPIGATSRDKAVRPGNANDPTVP